jgi:hypothetical protein
MQSLAISLFLSFLLIFASFADRVSVQSALQPIAPDKTQQSSPPPSQESSTAPQSSPSGASHPKPAPGFAFGLEDGTPVPLKLARELSSAKESAGNRVDFEVAEDITVNGIIVIPKGAMAWGTIVDAKPKRRLGRAGKLDVRIDEVRLADGERAPLRASQESKGKGRSGVMTGAIVASGVLFFPAAPLFLFMHGKDVVIAKGAPVTAYIDQNTALDRSKFATPPPPTPPNAQPAAQPATPPPAAFFFQKR